MSATLGYYDRAQDIAAIHADGSEAATLQTIHDQVGSEDVEWGQMSAGAYGSAIHHDRVNSASGGGFTTPAAVYSASGGWFRCNPAAALLVGIDVLT